MEALKDKSMVFAIRIVNLYRYLSDKHFNALSNQVLRSGTAIGALYREADMLRADWILFINWQ